MAARFVVSLILSTGGNISGIATQEDAAALVAAGNFTWPEGLSDRDKERAVIESRLAFSIQKDTGVFVLASAESGQEALIGNQWIIGGVVVDRLVQDQPLKNPMGFQFAESGAR